MAGLIPKDFINDLLARTDIVNLIDSIVKLKKAGKDYQACCPFHNEKTPSFTVSEEKQFYHCFGCGAHGNAISFLMEYEKLEFVEAIEELAQRQGIEVPREQSSNNANWKPSVSREQAASDHELMDQATTFFEHQLKSHANAQTVIDYLKTRGLSGETVKRFRIGYAPSEWNHLLNQLGRNNQQRQQLHDLKLLSHNNGRDYDFFRDRLMFPIRNKRGKVIAFGGRVLGDGTPKYLNSPETRIFHKGRELYGLYEVRQQENLKRVLVVEGYMDVVALAENGVDYAVAALGTATTPEHIQTLFRTVKQVVCCYDGDRAGRDAAWRAVENALIHLKDGNDLRFVFLPDGEDPDSQIRKEGKEAFEQRLAASIDFIQFFFDKLIVDINLGTDAGRAELIATAKPLIEKIPSDFYRDNLLERLSLLVGKDKNRLSQYIGKPTIKLPQTNKLKITPMRRAIALLVQHPDLVNAVKWHDSYRNIDIPGFDLLVEIQQLITSQQVNSTAQILELFRERKEGEYLAKLTLWTHHIHEESLIEDFQQTFQFLLDEYLRHRLDQLLLKEKTTALNANERREYQSLVQALSSRQQKPPQKNN